MRRKFAPSNIVRRQSAGVIVWFSCGAASAYLAKLASELYGSELEVVYCDTSDSEHPDNLRFLADVELWIGRKITKLKSSRYSGVDDVFEQKRFLSSPFGAPCTVEMKKRVRFDYQHADDLHLFGMTLDESARIDRFTNTNIDLKLRWLLREREITKDDCLEAIRQAGIAIPIMYTLGYRNNNCLGCVKAGSPAYWNKVRVDFPEVFALRVEQSRRFGSKLVQVKGVRIQLGDLQPEVVEVVEEDLSCGPQCSNTEEEEQEEVIDVSSTGRGPKLDPSNLDDYPTPAWCVHRLLETWTPRRGPWIEPCAGAGAIIRAVNECLPSEEETCWHAYEVNSEKAMDLRKVFHGSVFGSAIIRDFLAVEGVDDSVTTVITNPPYTLAAKIIEHCRLLYPYAEVVMLLRAGLMESEGREAFWKRVGVPDLSILPNRPSFRNSASGAMKTDSTLYSWFLWPPAAEVEPRSEGRVRILGQTSLEDRKQWR